MSLKIIRKIKNLIHFFEALVANAYYGFPGRKIKVIGVTGTDGKTTTTSLIYHILKSAGKKVSMISTVYAKVGNKEYHTGLHTTTPSSFLIQKLLNLSVKAADEYFILETTSHALDQNRVWGVDFLISVITNVTHEHLDYHLSYESYLKTKTILLQRSGKAVLNKDDRSFDLIKKIIKDERKIITYGFQSKTDYSLDLSQRLNLELADFNKYNYLAAYVIADYLKIPEHKIFESMKNFSLPPGRLDMVYKGKFSVMVDFAHTPNAIDVALKTIKKQYLRKPGRLIHVFGSAGLRDVSKRPLMGRASAKYSDIIILTEEDYRTEDPENICREISKGINSKEFLIITDRYKAVEKAVLLARENDLILLTGKGHERSLCRGSKEYDWNDKDKVLEIIRKNNV